MTQSLVAPIILLAFSIILSRIISIRALRFLSEDQRMVYFKAFNDLRKYQLFVLILLIGLLFVASKYYPQYPHLILIGYFVLFIAYFIARSAFMWNRLRKTDIPAEYNRMYLLSSVIQLAGIVIFAIWIFTSPEIAGLKH